ncbi:MAG: hypothetical protein ABI716_00375 [Candidatus Saccharibacteria bacterium]
MGNLKSLYGKVTDLHRVIDRNLYEAELATHDSHHYNETDEPGRAAEEANRAMRLAHENYTLQIKVIDMEQQILDDEKRILQLQQHDTQLREDCLHRIAYIDHETMQKVDDVTRQMKTLRG